MNNTPQSDRDNENETENAINENDKKKKNQSRETVTEKKPPLIHDVFDYVEVFVFSVLAVLIVFSFGARLCRVSGDSMNNTLKHNEMLIISDIFYEPSAGDIIVFHQTGKWYNEPIVKRVIATEGQKVKIDFYKGEVYVDGVLLEEDYAFVSGDRYISRGYPDYDFDRSTGIFETVVPEGQLFVMGDNRNNSTDSRSSHIGFVDKRRVLGEVKFRISPFTVFD